MSRIEDRRLTPEHSAMLPPEPQLKKRPARRTAVRPRPPMAAPASAEVLAPLYRGSGKLYGKVALVTAADAPVSRLAAVLFAREGADVLLLYRNGHLAAQETREAVESEGRRALLLAGDAGDSRFCKKAVEACLKEFGHLDVLALGDAASAEAIARVALPHMQEGGAVITLGAGPVYDITRRCAREQKSRGIRVNGIDPGPDRRSSPEAGWFERPAQPEEIAPAFVFFASEVDSSCITGQMLRLLGE